MNLALSILVMFIGFIVSVVCGIFLIPILRKFKASQTLSVYLERAHNSKSGTPTMGGLIFIIPVLIIILFMFIFGKFKFSYNFIIVIFTFISYALIGFIDDLLIIIKHNNKGLSVNQKFFLQLIVSVIFFYLFMKGNNEPLLWIHSLGIKYKIGFLYGVLILFILVSSSNAVNITDGLDGLAGGLAGGLCAVIGGLVFVIIASGPAAVLLLLFQCPPAGSRDIRDISVLIVIGVCQRRAHIYADGQQDSRDSDRSEHEQ